MIDMNAEINRTKEGSRLINFMDVFHQVSRSLSGAYSVPEDFYAQSASMARFENGISVNSAKEFLDHVHYDPDKAARIAEDFATSRKLADIGVAIGPEEFLQVGPDAESTGRSRTIAALAQRAARLESLLTPNGIPEAYATAQTQVRRALSVVEKAAGKAYDWNTSWGKLTVDNALDQAKGTVTRQKVAQAAMVGVFALAGCDTITISLATPEGTTGQGTNPTVTEVVPAMTETPASTATVTLESTQTQTPTQAPTETPAPTPTETPTITPTETLAPTPEGIAIAFDMSRPETITAADGTQYEGYLLDDHYGTRLVDNLNNIILVKKEESWRVPQSLNYSPEYPAVFYETKTGHSDGFDIPITLGLSENVQEAVGFHYTEAHMTQLGADDVASAYLHSVWARYRDIMNHPDIPYEGYLELLREGKGNIEILNTITKKTNLIDPRQGFSVVITGDKNYEMPIRYYDGWGYNYSSDEKGRLLWANNIAYNYSSSIDENANGTIEKNRWFLFQATSGIVWISVLRDGCMVNIVQKVCQFDPAYVDFKPLIGKLFSDYNDFSSNKSSDPLFILH